MKIYRLIKKFADEYSFFDTVVTKEMFFQNLDDAVPVWKEWCEQEQKSWAQWFSKLQKDWYNTYPEMKTEFFEGENSVRSFCIYEEQTQRYSTINIEEIELQ